MLTPMFTSLKVLFLSDIRKPEVFSVAIVVNCDQIAHDEILGAFKACESLMTSCADTEHGPWLTIDNTHGTT